MCGLMGYSGKAPFNFAAGKIMTLLQEDRGKTSVGFVIGNYHFKDMGAPDFFFKKWMFDYPKNAKLAFIHNRMPSKGLSTKENAHPFCYSFSDEGGKERKAYFAHNGTLRNCDELCEKYNIEKTKFDTDSELLGYIITHFGFDVLSEYKGAAAFFYTREDQPNVLYVWKGASRQATDTIEEERPLFYADVKGGTYFASTEPAIRTALDLCKDNPAVYFPDNHLIAYREGIIISDTVYDRSNIEKQPFQNYMGYNRGQGGSQAPFSSTVTTKKPEVNVGKFKKLENKVTYNSENPEPDRRKLYPADAIYFQSGKFYCNGKPLNGEVRIDESQGVLCPTEYTFYNEGGDGGKCKAWYHGNDDGLNFEIECEELFFFDGIWLRDRESWKRFMNIKKSDYENEINYQQKQYLHPDATHFLFGKQNYRTLCLYRFNEINYTGTFHVRNRFSIFEYIVDTTKGNFYALPLYDLENDSAIDSSDDDSSPVGLLTSNVSVAGNEKSDMTQEQWSDYMGFTMTNIGVEDTENNMLEEEIISDLKDDYTMIREFIETTYKDYVQLFYNRPTDNDSNEALDFIRALYILTKRKDLVKSILNEAPF